MRERDNLEYLALPSALYDKIESDVADLFHELNVSQYPIDPIQIALDL